MTKLDARRETYVSGGSELEGTKPIENTEKVLSWVCSNGNCSYDATEFGH